MSVLILPTGNHWGGGGGGGGGKKGGGGGVGGGRGGAVKVKPDWLIRSKAVKCSYQSCKGMSKFKHEKAIFAAQTQYFTECLPLFNYISYLLGP